MESKTIVVVTPSYNHSAHCDKKCCLGKMVFSTYEDFQAFKATGVCCWKAVVTVYGYGSPFVTEEFS